MGEKILAALSGGVDSSVCAALLQKEGYDVEGMILRMHDAGLSKADIVNGKLSPAIKMARDISRKLHINFSVEDVRGRFDELVVKNFVEAYENNITPNPCIFCNRHFKFAEILRVADEKGIEKVATGHYAKAEYDSSRKRYIIKKAADETKDQSYMLYQLTQEQLSRVVLPLGQYAKLDIRKKAKELGFKNYNAVDSQDICFIPDGDYGKFIVEKTGHVPEPGNFVDTKGNVLGRHEGLLYYTIGQRKGLGLSLAEPMYVKEKRQAENEVVLCRKEELFTDEVWAENINFVAADHVTDGMPVAAKIRYSQNEAKGKAEIRDGILKVKFDEPVRAATPGQSMVLYEDDTILLGGIIIK